MKWGWGALILSLLLGGCATPHPHAPRRAGFFERLDHGGQAVYRTPTNDEGDSTQRVSGVKKAASHWQWPVRNVYVTSLFGQRPNEFHEGIDLRAKTGTPIFAVESGKVIYAGSRIRGYGNMVVIRHRPGLSTVYAHGSRILVKPGQFVRQGQKIALAGQSGHATAPHLHFEVRDGVLAIDPLRVLVTVGGKPISRSLRDLASSN